MPWAFDSDIQTTERIVLEENFTPTVKENDILKVIKYQQEIQNHF